MVREMAELKGKFVSGASWELADKFGRGEPRSKIMEKKEKSSYTAYQQNYCSVWTGASEGGLVQINKVMDLRKEVKSEMQGDKGSEYIISMDVARSESKSNNQSSIAIIKIKRSRDGRIKKAILVNIINISNGLDFFQQTVILKRLKKLFDAKAVIIDSNGVGAGMVDFCLQETIDPATGESLGCWKLINDGDSEFKDPETNDAEEILYGLKATGINHEIIINFIDYIETSKLQMLEKIDNSGYDIDNLDYFRDNVLPHFQTDFLIEEIANLKVKQGENGKLKIEKIVNRIDKDRFSALSYGLYYLKKFEDDAILDDSNSASDYFFAN